MAKNGTTDSLFVTKLVLNDFSLSKTPNLTPYIDIYAKVLKITFLPYFGTEVAQSGSKMELPRSQKNIVQNGEVDGNVFVFSALKDKNLFPNAL